MEIEIGSSPKLYQRVANAIVARIRSGKYPRGERLPPERELAEEFGVSRPTVREAMIALEIRGIVEARRGSGIYVVDTAPPDTSSNEQDIGPFEVTEARRLFDGEAAALAAAIITDEEIDRKSTRLNSSHVKISYAAFCLQTKKAYQNTRYTV